MAASSNNPLATADREIVISRVFDVPREAVFAAWAEPDRIGQWWGPRGFTTTTHSMDFRPGGVWAFVMHGPDGTDYDNRVEYREVAPPERLVYFHGSGKEDDPAQFDVTVTFEEQDGKTLLTMRSLFRSPEERNFVVEKYGAIEGGNQTLDRLGEYLAGA